MIEISRTKILCVTAFFVVVSIVGFLTIIPFFDGQLDILETKIENITIKLESYEGNMELANLKISIARTYHSSLLTVQSLEGKPEGIQALETSVRDYYIEGIKQKYFSVHNNSFPTIGEIKSWKELSLNETVRLNDNYTDKMVDLYNHVFDERTDIIKEINSMKTVRYNSYTLFSVALSLGTFFVIIDRIVSLRGRNSPEETETSGETSRTVMMGVEPNLETIDLILKESKDRFKTQIDFQDKFDTKIGVILATIGVILTISIRYYDLFVDSILYYYLGITSLFLSLLLGLGAFSPRIYQVGPEPRKLKIKYFLSEPTKLKNILIDHYIASFEKNRNIKKLKMYFFLGCFIALVISLVLLFISISKIIKPI